MNKILILGVFLPIYNLDFSSCCRFITMIDKGIYIVQGEINSVVGAIKRNSRWTTHTPLVSCSIFFTALITHKNKMHKAVHCCNQCGLLWCLSINLILGLALDLFLSATDCLGIVWVITLGLYVKSCVMLEWSGRHCWSALKSLTLEKAGPYIRTILYDLPFVRKIFVNCVIYSQSCIWAQKNHVPPYH